MDLRECEACAACFSRGWLCGGLSLRGLNAESCGLGLESPEAQTLKGRLFPIVVT